MPAMAPSFASSWRSFWHTMTSYDRHASHDSPYRTGQHVPLAQSRHAPLTSIATSALESRHDLSYAHDSIEDSSTFVNGHANGRMSPQSPYKPGMRTSLQRVSTDNSASEIQMQNFSDGLPPAPPVRHSWKRIDRWAEDTYTELYDNLSDPCTQNDVNELEHELDCTLPLDVRESLQIHDGQERGGLPTGIIFGCMLLDCEEVVQEWQNWRKVGDEYLSPTSSARNSTAAAAHANGLSSPVSATTPALPIKAFAGISAASASSSSAPSVPVAPHSPTNPQWRNDLLSRQTCHPPNTIQHAYTHPAWIPLARDWGGNCIAVDLAPGPAGKWGQIIMFGRDYDCKFVIARSWAHFLAAVADDFGAGDFKLDDTEGRDGRGNGGKVFVDEETGELRFREFWERQPGVDVPYLEVLRWRCERKYGRRAMQKRPSLPGTGGGGANGKTGLRINPNAPVPQRSFSGQHDSPYASPTASVSSEQGGAPERGRSPSRFSQAPGKQPLVSSPLARVAEEPGGQSAAGGRKQPISVRTDLPAKAVRGSNADKLVSVDSPRPSGDFPLARVTSFGSVKADSPLLMKENNKRSSDGDTGAGAAAPPRLGVDGLLATPVAYKPPFDIGEGGNNGEAEKKDSPQSKESELKNVDI